MNPKDNPFVPGAGTPPPELAGRSAIITDAEVAIARAKRGVGKSAFFLGLRGVGKTVLLNRIAQIAEQERCLSIQLEAPEDKSLAEMLVPALRGALLKLSAAEKTRRGALKALGVLRSFAAAFKLKLGEVELGVKAEPGTADSGTLEHDLPELFAQVSMAARDANTALVLFVDEVQYLSQDELSALIVSVHKLGQRSLPFIVFGAGLPQLAALAGDAKSYAERLFDYPGVGPLTLQAAGEALTVPLHREGQAIEAKALDAIVEKTARYPYFIQEWGYQAWNAAAKSPIGQADVKLATKAAIERLDAGFFKVRFDRLTPRERNYMIAMASLGAGPHRSGDIAAKLRKTVTEVGPLRDGLIKKGMIYSPRHGETAFTVPMFDEFLRRVTADEA